MSGAPLKYTVSATVARRAAGAAGAGRRRPGAAAHHQDLQGREELPPRRRRPVFDRAIPIRRAAILLPAGYQLTECNVPSQVLADPDGRIRVSFMHQAPGAAALVLKAKPGAPTGDAAKPRPLTNARSWEAARRAGPDRARAPAGARAPSGSRHRLFPAGAGDARVQPVPRLHRVARRHGQVSQRRAHRQHGVEHLGKDSRHRRGAESGDDHRRADEGGRASTPAANRSRADQQVVVTRFSPVKKGQSVRLRLSETYTAPQSYRLERRRVRVRAQPRPPRNSVVLPRGWYLTALSIPAVVRQTPDGLTRVDFVNGRPGFDRRADEREDRSRGSGAL